MHIIFARSSCNAHEIVFGVSQAILMPFAAWWLAARGVVTMHNAGLAASISFILGITSLTFRMDHFETMELIRCVPLQDLA